MIKMLLADFKVIAPPEPALPNGEDEEEFKPPVIMLPLADFKLIVPPEPVLPSKENE